MHFHTISGPVGPPVVVYGRIPDSRLADAAVRTLQRPVVRPNPWDGYAMGLWVYPLWNAGRLVGDDSGSSETGSPVMLEHGGDSESYASSILLVPEEDLAVVVLLNVNDSSVPSLYHQMHMGIATLLLGEDPPPTIAHEGAIDRYAKVIAVAVVGLFLIRLGVSAFRLRRSPKSSPSLATSTVLRHVLLPLAIDLLLVGAVWWVLADQAEVPLTLVRRSVPDIFLAAVVASVIGVPHTGRRSHFEPWLEPMNDQLLSFPPRR